MNGVKMRYNVSIKKKKKKRYTIMENKTID